MEKGIQRRETQTISWRNDPDGLRQDTYSKAVKLAPGLQSQVLLKTGGRRSLNSLQHLKRQLLQTFTVIQILNVSEMS